MRRSVIRRRPFRRHVRHLRRKFGRRLQRRGHSKNIYKKASKIINKSVSKYKHCKIDTIPRSLTQNFVIRKFSKCNTYQLVQSTINAANGVFGYQYLLGDMMEQPDLTYYINRFYRINLLEFCVTFFYLDINNLTSTYNAGAPLTNLAVTQCQMPSTQPTIYIDHFNDSASYFGYASGLDNTVTAIDYKINSRPSFGLLRQRQRIVRKWHTPARERGNYLTTTGLSIGSTVNAVCTAPVSNEPSGFRGLWRDVNTYVSATPYTILLGYKIDSVFILKERQPST